MDGPPPAAAGGGGAAPPLDWFHLVSHVVGGVALLNFSLSTVSRALRTAFGPRLRDAIRRATRTRARAFATGVAVTALLSSATASSLLVLAFVESGDMTLSQSLGIGLGIGLGSTLNAHLLSLSLSRYAMALVAGGYALHSWGGGGARVAGNLGEATLGLGLLFASTSVISSALAPLKSHAPFVAFIGSLRNPALALLVSALAAVAFQSSNTVIAIVIMLAQQGFLSSEGCCTLVLGANVGTSVTPVLAALGKRREALRVAVAYLALKVAGIASLLPLLGRFVGLVQWSTVAAQARAEDAAYDAMVDAGAVRADASLEVAAALRATGARAVLPTQVALAHTYANAWVALVCLPFLDAFARAVVRWVPGDDHDGDGSGAGGGGAGSGGLAPSSSSASSSSSGGVGGSGGYGATAVGMLLHHDGRAGGSPGELSARRAAAGSDADGGEGSDGGALHDPSRRLFARRR